MQLDDSIAEIQISAIWLQSYGNRKKSKVVSRVCAPRLGPFFASSPPRPLDILTRLHDELARRLQVLRCPPPEVALKMRGLRINNSSILLS